MRNIALRNHQDVTPVKKLAHNCDLVLADISGSMCAPSGQAGLSKWDCLKTALKAQGDRIAILAFETFIHEVFDANNLPDPMGGTNLNKALIAAIELEPIHVLVVSDGEPQNQLGCFKSAAKLATDCIIDTLFIGSDHDAHGIYFMQELAKIGRGRFVKYDLEQTSGPLLLTEKVSNLLALPPAGVIEL